MIAKLISLLLEGSGVRSCPKIKQTTQQQTLLQLCQALSPICLYINGPVCTVMYGNMHAIIVPLPGSPIHVAYLQNLHYQSIIPINEVQISAINTCEVCKKSVKSIMMHLAKGNSCRMLVSESRFSQLKLRAKSETLEK